MEVTGFVFTVLTLAGLFNNAVQCFEYVKLGHDFKLDFATGQINLDLAQKRLSRWGKALGLDRVESDEQQLPVNRGSEEERRKVGIALKHLIKLFNEAEERSKSYREPSSTTSTASNITDIEDTETTISAKLKNMSINSLNKAATKAKNRTKWALHGKEAVTKLINDIIGLISQLEVAFPAPTDVYKDLVTHEVEEVAEGETSEALAQLQAAALPQDGSPAQDPALADGLGKKIEERQGAVYEENTVEGKDVRVQDGNVVAQGYTGQMNDTGSTYKKNAVKGDGAKVLHGTTFGGKGFWD
ncbi:Prion-inhibition and propagation domain containing protein [Hyaloscypha variabilis]